MNIIKKFFTNLFRNKLNCKKVYEDFADNNTCPVVYRTYSNGENKVINIDNKLLKTLIIDLEKNNFKMTVLGNFISRKSIYILRQIINNEIFFAFEYYGFQKNIYVRDIEILTKYIEEYIRNSGKNSKQINEKNKSEFDYITLKKIEKLINAEKGYKFEYLILGLYSKNKDYKELYWNGNYGDKGVDIKAVKNNGDIELIQCKYRDIHKTYYYPVFNKRDFQLEVAGKIVTESNDNIYRSIVLATNNYFDSNLIKSQYDDRDELKKHIKLIDRNYLKNIIYKIYGDVEKEFSNYKKPFEKKEEKCKYCGNDIFIKAKYAAYSSMEGEYDYCIYCANDKTIADKKP